MPWAIEHGVTKLAWDGAGWGHQPCLFHSERDAAAVATGILREIPTNLLEREPHQSATIFMHPAVVDADQTTAKGPQASVALLRQVISEVENGGFKSDHVIVIMYDTSDPDIFSADIRRNGLYHSDVVGILECCQHTLMREMFDDS